MSPFVAVLAVAALAAVAAAGVAAGFLRRDPVPVEPLADPLEDRRLALLRSLADLEDARSAGALEDAAYRRLRRDTEGRMARLLHAIDERRSRSSTAAGRRSRVSATGGGDAAGVAVDIRAPGRVPPWAVATLLVSTVLAVAVAGLLRSTEPATSGSSPAVSEDPLAPFEQRVRDHPNDLAARLDLAHRYLDLERIDEAWAQYRVALELDPDDAEALAHVGLILYRSQRPEEALASVDRALETAPDYPEALFIRGVIQLEGLDRPAAAVDAFEAYLVAAPFGSERATAQDLIAVAEDVLARRERPGA